VEIRPRQDRDELRHRTHDGETDPADEQEMDVRQPAIPRNRIDSQADSDRDTGKQEGQSSSKFR
jgi:hypothetical protein